MALITEETRSTAASPLGGLADALSPRGCARLLRSRRRVDGHEAYLLLGLILSRLSADNLSVTAPGRQARPPEPLDSPQLEPA